MYERMLHKQAVPTIEEMTEYCAENAKRFSMINDWLTTVFNTEQKVILPYGNNEDIKNCKRLKVGMINATNLNLKETVRELLDSMKFL